MIAIIDYDAGNMLSVEKAFEYIGEEKVLITRDKDEIISADKVILPGVGSFGDAMKKLNKYNLINIINDVIEKKTPFFGICLGMQLLFKSSEEGDAIPGLGILDGEILRIPDKGKLKIPHMGWNSLNLMNDGRLFKNIDNESYVYFVHSYYLKAKDESIVTASSEYGTIIHSSIEKDNVFGCQFHPEKSGEVGINILKNFINLDKEIN